MSTSTSGMASIMILADKMGLGKVCSRLGKKSPNIPCANELPQDHANYFILVLPLPQNAPVQALPGDHSALDHRHMAVAISDCCVYLLIL